MSQKIVPIKESKLVDIMNNIVTMTIDKRIAEAKEQWKKEEKETFIAEQKEQWLTNEKKIWLKETKIVVEGELFKKITSLEKEIKLLTK